MVSFIEVTKIDMLSSTEISFRKVKTEDLPLMHKWLNEPHVHEWYDKDKDNTFEEVTKRYDPKIVGKEPTDCYIVLYEKTPVGYIQTYKVNDWPEFGEYVRYDDHTSSIDLFIGEISFIGRGLGSLMLRKFLIEIIFSKQGISTCIIGPEPKNIRAIKAYEKAGFKYVKTVQVGDEPDPTYIMEIKK
jgi:RimJ/RimL family protein N-acetyltransferase